MQEYDWFKRLKTNFSEICIHWFSLNEMHLKMSSAKWRPYFIDPNMSTKIFFNSSRSILDEVVSRKQAYGVSSKVPECVVSVHRPPVDLIGTLKLQFSILFIDWYVQISWWKYPQMTITGSYWWFSGNGLMPSRRHQTIIWANVNSDPCRHMTTLCHSELTQDGQPDAHNEPIR